jgi:hypothetical protein
MNSNPRSKTVNYAIKWRTELKVHLSDLAVLEDTNYLVRTLRLNSWGEENWLFFWIEIGAEHVDISMLQVLRILQLNLFEKETSWLYFEEIPLTINYPTLIRWLYYES